MRRAGDRPKLNFKAAHGLQRTLLVCHCQAQVSAEALAKLPLAATPIHITSTVSETGSYCLQQAPAHSPCTLSSCHQTCLTAPDTRTNPWCSSRGRHLGQMAVSLLCKDCDTLFRNVQEAQAHNEATGHANFEESTRPVRVHLAPAPWLHAYHQPPPSLQVKCVDWCMHAQVPQMVCTTCGKPCRSDAERALHTKYTGHTEFVDKVRAGSWRACTTANTPHPCCQHPTAASTPLVTPRRAPAASLPACLSRPLAHTHRLVRTWRPSTQRRRWLQSSRQWRRSWTQTLNCWDSNARRSQQQQGQQTARQRQQTGQQQAPAAAGQQQGMGLQLARPLRQAQQQGMMNW